VIDGRSYGEARLRIAFAICGRESLNLATWFVCIYALAQAYVKHKFDH
jgi:hypothetical protein